ncbi:MAG: GNAT family N-acetyltransferase [Erysipelothrix sp.]
MYQIVIEPRNDKENQEYLMELLEEHQYSNNREIFFEYQKYSFILSENDKVMGGYYATQHDDVVHLHLLAVDKKARKKRYGVALLKHLINLAIDQDATRITLTTLDFQAKDFYIKQGFHIFGELENTPVKGVKKYYLTMEI